MESRALKILLVRTSAIGDVVQTLPTFAYLRKMFPSAKISWVVESPIAPLLQRLEGLYRVLSIDTGKWRQAPFSWRTFRHILTFVRNLRNEHYDLVLDLQGNTKSGLITWFARAQEKVGFGWRSVREKANWFATWQHVNPPQGLNVRKVYLALAEAYAPGGESDLDGEVTFTLNPEEEVRLHDLKKRRGWMVAVGSRWKNKRLSQEALSLFLRKVAERGVHLFLVFGNELERKEMEALASTLVPHSVELVGDLSLPLWQTWMKEVDGVIAVDSAALHLAGTTGTPSFSVFGPTQASLFQPLGAQHHVLQGACPYNVQFVKQCPRLRSCPTGACIRNLSGEALFQYALKKLTKF